MSSEREGRPCAVSAGPVFRNSALWLWALSVVVLVGSCRGGGGTSAVAEVAEGQDLFRKTCATCHGPNAEGMPRLGQSLFDNDFVQSRSDEDLVTFLKIGRPASDPANERGVDMPPRGGNNALTDQDLTLIVAYLRSLR